jgi:hypothetical protein
MKMIQVKVFQQVVLWQGLAVTCDIKFRNAERTVSYYYLKWKYLLAFFLTYFLTCLLDLLASLAYFVSNFHYSIILYFNMFDFLSLGVFFVEYNNIKVDGALISLIVRWVI